MTDRQASNENGGPLNPDEAKAAIEKWFASIIGTLSLNNAILEKRLTASQQAIQQLTANEVALIDRIRDLEGELEALKPEKTLLSPEAEKIATEAKAVIDEIEKAAPV